MVPDNYSTKPWGGIILSIIYLLVISGMCGTELEGDSSSFQPRSCLFLLGKQCVGGRVCQDF